jgi:hypothetical protein
VVDDLGLVLRGDAGDEALTLRLGDAELLVRVADVLREVLPRLRLLLGGAHEVLDVVEVDVREVGTPRRHRLAAEQLISLEAGLQHPLGFVLERRDPADDVLVDPALGDGARGVFVVPAEFVDAQSSSSGRSMSTSDMGFASFVPGGVIRSGIPAPAPVSRSECRGRRSDAASRAVRVVFSDGSSSGRAPRAPRL